MALTDLACRRAQPRIGDYKIGDSNGLFLIIRPGGNKSWGLRYRHGGKDRTLGLGAYPEISLAEARDRRDAARRLLRDGVDPGEHKRQQVIAREVAAANSFEAVALEWLERHKSKWDEDTAAQNLDQLERFAFPVIGNRPLTDLRPPEILRMVRKIEDQGKHQTAHRVLGLASRTFRYGVATGRVESDPCRDLRGALAPAPKPKHHHPLTEAMLPELLTALNDNKVKLPAITILGLKLLLHTATRRDEVRCASWSELDLDKAIWKIPPHRMKKRRVHVVPLSKQAVALFRELRAMSDGEYVFASIYKPGSRIGINVFLDGLYSLGFKDRASVHGFRSLFSTMLNERDRSSELIEMSLAHVEQNKIRDAYNRAERLPERRALMQEWSNILDALGSGASPEVLAKVRADDEQRRGNVVPIKRRASR